MTRSVSLSAYLALARRAPSPAWTPPAGQRPKGMVIWLHAASQHGLSALLYLASLFEGHHGNATFLITLAEDIPPPTHLPPGVILGDLPPESLSAVDSFLSHWQPDLGIWSTGHLRPALLSGAAKRALRMILVDAQEHALDEARWRLLPGMSRGLVRQFHYAMARTGNAGRRLQRLGMPPSRIDVAGQIQPGGQTLDHDESERADLAATISGRPVWLAGMVRPEELEIVLQAHRQSSRAAHRLLLILVPDHEADGAQYAARARAAGWRVAQWSAGEMPSETTQVLLADTRGDMGLWYRLAPMSFMGSSLVEGCDGSDPFEPAALGSAILTGPRMGRYAQVYDQMVAAGAARIVRDTPSLASAVSHLTAPDRAAAMAHAAWNFATQGAEATDRLFAMIEDVLDGGDGMAALTPPPARQGPEPAPFNAKSGGGAI